MAKGKPRDGDTMYVLLELGPVIAARVPKTRRNGGPGPRASCRGLFEAALERLPELEGVLAGTGLVLAGEETKSHRAVQRLAMRKTTWRHLGRVAERLDLTRPQLLRALLRRELGLIGPAT